MTAFGIGECHYVTYNIYMVWGERMTAFGGRKCDKVIIFSLVEEEWLKAFEGGKRYRYKYV